MGKIKILTGISLGAILSLLGAGIVLASPSVLSIQTLPAFENTNNFKISCTTDGTTAQFSYSKNGGGFTNFGPAINVPTNPGGCIVQVDSSVVNDQTNYSFKVNVDGSDSSTTSTTYDISGPSPVSGYYKETAGTDTFRLHWRNPSDSDFAKVIIYRGVTPDFSADSGHEIAQVLGGANSDMTFENHVPDPTKTNYFSIRAVDMAGNSSSLVGDVTTTTATPTPSAGGTGTVQVLPKEQGTGGSVLSKETSASAEPTAEPLSTTQAKAAPFGLSRNKIIGIGALAILLGLAAYFFTRRGK